MTTLAEMREKYVRLGHDNPRGSWDIHGICDQIVRELDDLEGGDESERIDCADAAKITGYDAGTIANYCGQGRIAGASNPHGKGGKWTMPRVSLLRALRAGFPAPKSIKENDEEDQGH